MAAVDYFMKFEGIKGESVDAKHKDEIDVESWSWGETRSGAGGAGSGGRDLGLQFNTVRHQVSR
jgi:type VI secretion system secreted protein Hcp